MTEQFRSKRQGIGSVITSVLAAFIGVQSNRKRNEDFTKGKISTFIIAGLIGTTVFVLFIVGMVKLVMTLAMP
jgi:predicted Co/Zn/Cd cation transporter (cation efflux family)